MKIKSIRQSANNVGQSLSRHARQIDEDIVWLKDSPPPVLETLYLDSLSISTWMKVDFGFKKRKKEKEKRGKLIKLGNFF